MEKSNYSFTEPTYYEFSQGEETVHTEEYFETDNEEIIPAESIVLIYNNDEDDDDQTEHNTSSRCNKSIAWEFFTKKSKSTVECRVCEKVMKYSGGTGTMLQHLSRIHPTQLLHAREPPTDNESTLAALNLIRVVKKEINVDDLEPTTSADLDSTNETQQDSDTYRSPSNLKAKQRKLYGARSNKSIAWEYFTRKSNSTVECRICDKVVKSSGGTGNLLQHLKRVHPEQYLPTDTESTLSTPNLNRLIKEEVSVDDLVPATSDLDSTENSVRSNKSIAWDFFSKITSSIVECRVCKRVVKYSGGTGSMLQHLKRLHPAHLQARGLLLTDTESSLDTSNLNRLPKNEVSADDLVPATSNLDSTNESQQDSASSGATRRLHSSRRIKQMNLYGGRCNKSIAWEYFTKKTSSKVECRVCKKIVKYSGGTGSMLQHLKRIHPTQFLPDLPTDTRRVKQMKVSLLSQNKIKQIDDKLIKMIVSDFQPLSIVENEGFLEYTRLLNTLYIPPNREKISEILLPQLYQQFSDQLKILLKTANHAAITTDMWTSENNIGYITVACHFISGIDAKIYSRVLETRKIEEISSSEESHTDEALATAIASILNEWDIYSKIITVVSDDTANLQKAVTDHLKMHNHPCLAQTLNLCVNNAISNNETLNRLLKKCRSIMGHFHHSILATETLELVQEEMNLPILKVKQDGTSWNSVLLMIERLMEIKDPLAEAMSRLSKLSETFFDTNELQLLQDCTKVLKPAQEVTKVLSADRYCTLSMVVPLIRGMQCSLRKAVVTTKDGEQLKNKLLELVTHRLGPLECNEIVAKATFLDPRFKKYAFGTDDNATNAQKWVTEELLQNMEKKTIATYTISLVQQPPSESVSDSSDIWSHLDRKISATKTHSTLASTVSLIVKQYLELAPMDRDKDPLEFWTNSKHLMPELCKLAFKYLCIPATSVPAERVFSEDGLLTSARRNRLSAENVDVIVFLNSAM